MNALHYDGCQSRARCIGVFVNNGLNKKPVFPEPRPESAMRIGEALDVDYLYSGHFNDTIKTKLDFAGTVTTGSPLWVKKGDVKRPPSNEERLILQGLPAELEYLFPEGTPQDQIRLAIGNAVPVNLAFWIAKTIMEEIFEVQVEYEYAPVTIKSKEKS